MQDNLNSEVPTSKKIEVTPDKLKKKNTVGILQLTVITYCLVCSGSYGIEEAVQAAGPFWVIMCLIAVAFMMGLPASMIYSEMGNMFSQTGSTILWALDIVHGIEKETYKRAMQVDIDQTNNQKARSVKKLKRGLNFAKFVSRLSANMLLLKAVIDNSVYPCLICDYLSMLTPALNEWYFRLIVAIVAFSMIYVFNMFGIDAVGVSQYILAVFILLPCIFFILFSFPQWEAKHLSPSNMPETLDFGTVLSNLVWQFAGFDQLTNLGGDVDKPQRTYPISYMLVVLMVLLTYVLTIMAGAMIEQDFDNWNNGGMAIISLKLWGCSSGWLQWWLILGGAVSGLTISNSSVSCTARELYSNAHCKLLPFGSWVDKLRSFRKQPPIEQVDIPNDPNSINIDFALLDEDEMDKIGLVPWVATIIVTVVPMFITLLPFNFLVSVDSFLIALNMLIQMCFYIYAKHGRYGYYSRHPPSDKVFRVDGGVYMTVFLVMCPICVAVVLCCTQGYIPVLIVIGLQLVLFALWGIEIMVNNRRQKKVNFSPISLQMVAMT